MWMKNYIQNSSWLKKFTIAFVTVFIISVLGILLATYFYPPERKQLGIELTKSFLQIITVLIIGQGVSLMVAEFNRERQKQDEATKTARQKQDRINEVERQKAKNRNEFQKDVLKRLVSSYTKIKKARRLLRAKGLHPPYSGVIDAEIRVRHVIYDEQMQAINDIELEIEEILEEVRTSSLLFANSSDLAGHIEDMKDYLRALIAMYEQKVGKFSDTQPTLFLSEFAVECGFPESKYYLADFLGETEGSVFKREFIKKYRAASKMIRKEILGHATT